MGCVRETVAKWEKDKSKPMLSQFKRLLAFLEYDPTLSPHPVSRAYRGETPEPRANSRLGGTAPRVGTRDFCAGT
jgi:hypothetical protein